MRCLPRFLRFSVLPQLLLVLLSLVRGDLVRADTTSDLLFNQAAQAYLKGDFDGAIEGLEGSLGADSANSKTKAFLVKVLVERGSQLYLDRQHGRAHSYLKKAQGLDPKRQDVGKMLEVTEQELGLAPKPAPPAPKEEGKRKTEEPGPPPDTLFGGAPLKELSPAGRLDLMSKLMDHFRGQQEKLVSGYLSPNQALLDQIRAFDRERQAASRDQLEERKRWLEFAEKKDKTLLETMDKQQKTQLTPKLFVLSLLTVVLGIGVLLLFVFGFISWIYSKREKAIFEQQERVMEFLVEKTPPTALLQGPSAQGYGADPSRLIEVLPRSAESDEMKEYLESPNPALRAKGVELLGAKIVRENVDAESVKTLIEPFLLDSNPEVRANAIEAYFHFFPAEALEEAVEMLNSPDRAWQQASVRALGGMGTEESAQVLLRKHPAADTELKSKIAQSLREIQKIQGSAFSSSVQSQIQEVLG